MKLTKKTAAALLLTAAMLVSILAGCSGSTTSQENLEDNTLLAASGAEGGEDKNPENVEGESYKTEIRIGTLTDLTSTNRYTMTSTVTSQTCNSLFNSLVSIDGEGEIIPELATEWTNNEDSTEWTFQLREGVKFHDGSDLTAEDVKFTWDYAGDIENEGVGQVIIGSSLVDEVVVDDTYTVTFKLTSSAADWIYYVTQDVICKSAIETLGMEEGGAIGTGPFYFDSIETGVSWTLKRFDGYWGEKPVTETITFVVVSDASSRALALRSGDIDAMYDGNTSDIVSFMGDSGFNVFEADNIQVNYAGFNATSEYGSNPIVRQAVAMAINRDDIITACYEGGACGTAAYNLISTVGVGYTDVDYYEYDPEGAKALLEENGLDGITLELYTFAKYIPEAEIIQANLAAIGVTLNITEWTQTGFTAAITEDNGYDLGINCTSQYGGVLSVMSEYLRAGTTRAFMKYDNEEFETRLADGLTSATYDEMLEKYAALQQFVAEDVPVIALSSGKLFCIGTSSFYGVRLNAQAIDVDFSYSYVIEG